MHGSTGLELRDTNQTVTSVLYQHTIILQNEENTDFTRPGARVMYVGFLPKRTSNCAARSFHLFACGKAASALPNTSASVWKTGMGWWAIMVGDLLSITVDDMAVDNNSGKREVKT